MFLPVYSLKIKEEKKGGLPLITLDTKKMAPYYETSMKTSLMAPPISKKE
jgi:hypothetical protein